MNEMMSNLPEQEAAQTRCSLPRHIDDENDDIHAVIVEQQAISAKSDLNFISSRAINDNYCDNESTTKVMDPGSCSSNPMKVQHLSLATVLILTYLIEIGTQIFLTLQSCPSIAASLVNSLRTSGHGPESDYFWTWFLLISLCTIISSVLVTTVSIIWVCLGLDFAGRFCGRLLCYVMHFLHLGLLWRYFKLALAYDHADIQEFIALRTFQIFIQSLPLTTIHLAWFITTTTAQVNWYGPTPWLILIEISSVVAAIIISSFIKQLRPESNGCNVAAASHQATPNDVENHKPGLQQVMIPVFSSRKKSQSSFNSPTMCQLQVILNVMSRAVLIYVRLIVLAILTVVVPVWILIVMILAHLTVTVTWASACIFRQHKIREYRDICVESEGNVKTLESSNNNNNHQASKSEMEQENQFRLPCQDLVRKVIEFSYVLFWDICTTTTSGNKNQNDSNLSIWLLPIHLVVLENYLALGFVWFQQVLPQNVQVLMLGTGACLTMSSVAFYVNNFNLARTCTISKLCHVTRRVNNSANVISNTSCSSTASTLLTLTTTTSTDINAKQSPAQISGSSEQIIIVNENNDYSGNHKNRAGNNRKLDSVVHDDDDVQKLDQEELNDYYNNPLSSADLTFYRKQKRRKNDNDDEPNSWDFSKSSLEKKPRKCSTPATNNYNNIISAVLSSSNTNIGARRAKKMDEETGSEHIHKKMTMKGLIRAQVAPEVSSGVAVLRSSSSPTVTVEALNLSRNYPVGLSTTWVPDTCCNDSNGSSSNSRNTNTILTELGVSGEKSISVMEQDEERDRNPDHDDDEDGNELEDEDKRFVFYFPEHHSPLNSAATPTVTPSRTRKLNVHSTNSPTYKRPPRCRSSNSNKIRNQGELSPSSNIATLSFNSLQRTRTSTPVEIRKAARVIMNNSPYKYNVGGRRADHVDDVRVSGDQMSNSNKPGHDSGRCIPNKVTGSSRKPMMRSGNKTRLDAAVEIVDPSLHPSSSLISYDKLMEDSYGILICEGEPSSGNREAARNEKLLFQQQPQHHLLPSIFHVNKKLRVLCAKCLQNHDPLLTNCLLEDEQPSTSTRFGLHNTSHGPCSSNSIIPTHHRYATTPSETTEYPSGTEMTWTVHDGDEDEDDVDEDDQLSGDVSSSHLSTATYTTWPKSSYHPSQVQRQCQRQQQQQQQKLSMWTTMLPSMMNNNPTKFPKQFTSREYVRTWLLSSSQAVRVKQSPHYGTESRLSRNYHGNCGSSNICANKRSVPHHKSKEILGKSSTKRCPTSSQSHHGGGRNYNQPPEESYYETLSVNPSYYRPRNPKRKPSPAQVPSHPSLPSCSSPTLPKCSAQNRAQNEPGKDNELKVNAVTVRESKDLEIIV